MTSKIISPGNQAVSNFLKRETPDVLMIAYAISLRRFRRSNANKFAFSLRLNARPLPSSNLDDPNYTNQIST